MYSIGITVRIDIKKRGVQMDIQEDVINYISKIGKIPRHEMNSNVKIYNAGTISSLKLIELMSYIEKQYSFTIKSEELVEANFRDIGTLVDFITAKINELSGIVQ
jgi:acyl carrier protein